MKLSTNKIDFFKQLMSIERLTVFAAALRVCFLLFEALRTHLKFQLEVSAIRLFNIFLSIVNLA